MIKIAIYIGLFIGMHIANAQNQHVFYEDDNGNLIEQKQLDEKIAMFKKVAKQINEKGDVKITFSDTLTKGDSIIVKAKIDLTIDGKIISTSKEDKTKDNLMGKKFPSFKLNNLQNAEISLDDYLGKPTMINFWFKNCAPCIDEMPALNQLQEKYKNQVHFVAITFNTKTEVVDFLKTHDFQFEHLVDAKTFCDELSIEAYPYNLFLDASGKVVSVENGIPYMMDEDGKLTTGDASYFEEILLKML